ncbi:MAG: phosphatidylserine decarboxylase family protein [Sphingobacteriales bacterium]|jgi:phosphatidylserine decarboxylase|nr:phosphatidylserine decarboxylase family protein [Sphingobacteriales bacterium]MBP9142767.1 phosphatidylserine decarboxylase family protein [Chitinophagales bacterium]MDA0198516.1 phosphatidylserine decarboxylase family protein [Bacteroidota bacterium]MBK6889589.1 phosphatidylserine decarboxylase family protein [Sphingobacteriales bacterium]MBK7527902.1 phosphatidylserine decarboxylase family protein [Sphingobacteriales bacterium]
MRIKIARIHKEGYKIIAVSALLLAVLNILLFYFLGVNGLGFIVFAVSSVLLFLGVVSFFRYYNLIIDFFDDGKILAPADGKIVVIEEVDEPEYFKDRRIQVSIFMSPANVHINRTPISGVVKYTRYHPGNYLVAWHPKSSILNERYTSVIENGNSSILIRQIAGKLARKISNYLSVGMEVSQGDELGFIKFGSRVDIFLPINAKINVQLKQKVRSGKTVIAELHK